MYATIFWYIMTRVQVPSKEYLVCFLKTVARSPLIGVRKTHTHTHLKTPVPVPVSCFLTSYQYNTKKSLQLHNPNHSPSHPFCFSESHSLIFGTQNQCPVVAIRRNLQDLQHHIVDELVQWNETIHIFMCTVHKWFIPMELRHNWGCSSSQHQQTTNDKQQIYVYLHIYI